MTDLYKLCPCGSGKKIKFCCRDLAHELERVQRMLSGDQRLAAQDKINSLLAKHPDHAALLMLRAQTEMMLKEYGQARATIEQVREKHPHNPSAWGYLAALELNERAPLDRVIEAMQRALRHIDKVMPAVVYEALLGLSSRLAAQGLPMAARAHLELAAAVEGEEQKRGRSMLFEIQQNRRIPLLLRQPWRLEDAPSDVTWKLEYDQILSQARTGRWQQAVQQLDSMSTRILDEPVILKAQAVMHASLGQNREAAKAFRDFARLRTLGGDDRVEAEAVAQLLDPEGRGFLEFVNVTHTVREVDRLTEQLLADPHCRSMPVDSLRLPEGTPPPKALFEVLHRPAPQDGESLAVEQWPIRLGMFVIFGRQTDQPARLNYDAARDSWQFEQLQQRVEGLREWLEPNPEIRTVDHVPEVEYKIFPGVYRSPAEGFDQQVQRVAEFERLRLREAFPQETFRLLDGKTPAEAARDGNTRLTVQGMLLNLELGSRLENAFVFFNQLRQALELPPRDVFEASGEELAKLPVCRLRQLDAEKLPDEDLLRCYHVSYGFAMDDALPLFAHQILARPQLQDQIDKVEIYDMLSDMAKTTDESLQYLEEARKAATAAGESVAAWLIDELELRLLRGEMNHFQRLLQEIQTRHGKEPGVRRSLLELLVRYGLVSPDGQLRQPNEAAAAPAAAQPTAESAAPRGIWTPEGESAAAGEAGAGAKPASKLWMPGDE